jgi:hypothetical protein
LSAKESILSTFQNWPLGCVAARLSKVEYMLWQGRPHEAMNMRAIKVAWFFFRAVRRVVSLGSKLTMVLCC